VNSKKNFFQSSVNPVLTALNISNVPIEKNVSNDVEAAKAVNIPLKRTNDTNIINIPSKISRQRPIHKASLNKVLQYVIKARYDSLECLGSLGCKVKSHHEFLEYTKMETMEILQDNMADFKAIKVNLKLEATFTNADDELSYRAFKTKNGPMLESDDILEWLNEEHAKIIKEADESKEKKSGWTLASVNQLIIHVHKYSPMRGSSYIPLPEWIVKKKACINVHNEDMCFKYAMLSKFVEDQQNASRVSKYDHLQHTYDFSCIRFPPSLDEVNKFGSRHNVSINIFGLENENFYPLLVCKSELEDNRKINVHFV